MTALGYIFALLYASLCLALAFVANRLGMPKQYSRKLVHILVGFEWVILYNFFGAGWHTVIVCVFFLALLTVAYFKNLFPMMSSDDDNAPGTVYYAVSMTVMALVSAFVGDFMVPFGVAVICTSLGDGLAGVVGQFIKKYNPVVLGRKTLYGALTNLLVCVLGSYFFLKLMGTPIPFWHALIIGAFAVILELVSVKGLDNVTLPLGVSLLTFVCMYYSQLLEYAVPVILTPLIVYVVLTKKVLTPGGVIAAVVLDILVTVAFKNAGFIVLFTFLLVSVLTDKLKNVYKKSKKKAVSSESPRSEMQVIANGVVAAICAFANLFVPSDVFVVGFVITLSEALADTVSSGMGIFAKNTYDIFKAKKCEKGISGGVSLIGSAFCLISAFVLPLLAWAMGIISAIGMLVSALFAILGCTCDTLLGSLLQEKRKCTRCGRVTEETVHCKQPTVKYSGVIGFDNSTVNFLSSAFAVIVFIFVELIFTIL